MQAQNHNHDIFGHAITFGLAGGTFWVTAGHVLQGVFYALAAIGAFCAGVASLGNFIVSLKDRRSRKP